MEKVKAVFGTTQRVIARAKAEGIPTAQAAERIAEERINAVKAQKKIYKGD